MYIEYQGFFTHGGKSYNSKTDIVKLNKWKEKSKTSQFYTNALNIWIKKDVEKRKLALKNKKENEISIRELLSGFKISGIYMGYSFFSSMWFKYFKEKYNIKSIYDPTGGWGNRLLGSNDLDLYIYNDISKKTYLGIKNIINFLNIKNTIIYNKNMINFIPKENFESIFTCPPYDDIEKYENENNLKDIIDWIFQLKEIKKCKIVGIVLKENFEIYLPIFKEKNFNK